jgi:hypothetical protein
LALGEVTECSFFSAWGYRVETTEKIVEAYVRYVRRWATIPNIKCHGQFEIDLIAVDPASGKKYHIESGISGSQVYSKLTAKPFIPENLKIRGKIAGTRRTLGYFVQRKFGTKAVIDQLREFGFHPGEYQKIIVTWGWTAEAKIAADRYGIDLWDFRDLVQKIADKIKHRRTYFTDDTLRTINLFVRATKD